MEKRTTNGGTLIDVSISRNEKHYIEKGCWNIRAGRYEINHSSILSRLIQDTGRFALLYASDLFIMWEGFIETLEAWDEDSDVTYIFGIYQSGVHDAAAVINIPEERRHDYFRVIWGLRVKKMGDDIELTMERLDSVKQVAS